MRIVVATRNHGKIEELARLFGDVEGVELIGLDRYPDVADVIEDRDSFEGNARKKAREIADAIGLPALADDSGLEVDALGGAPGVYSARYAGGHGDDAANNRKLLAALEGVEPERRTARFRCVLVLAAAGFERAVHGVVEGRIADAPRGDAGFGYDPLFVPAGHDRTFAELGLAVKQHVSHRASAARAMREILRALVPS